MVTSYTHTTSINLKQYWGWKTFSDTILSSISQSGDRWMSDNFKTYSWNDMKGLYRLLDVIHGNMTGIKVESDASKFLLYLYKWMIQISSK